MSEINFKIYHIYAMRCASQILQHFMRTYEMDIYESLKLNYV